MEEDRNFDSLAEAFEQRIYGSIKGQLREQLLWWHLNECLPALGAGESMHVLDAAGGLGQMAVRLADQGHRVLLNDLSANMLAIARQRIADAGPFTHDIEIQRGSVQALCQQQDTTFDMILCHALLEWLAEPRACLELLLGRLKPGGYLSLAFYNRHALALKNALMGNVTYLLPQQGARKPKRKGLSPPNAQFPEEVLHWCEHWGLSSLGLCGIRVMTDWLPREAQQNSDLDTLLAIEKHYCQRQPYLFNGRYVHVVYRKPH